MNWRETLIKSKDIKWKRPPIKNIEDGKMDIIITIPLTSLFEAQAKNSFIYGMNTAIQFVLQHQGADKPIETDDLIKLFEDCGLPEYANELKLGQLNRE